MSDMDDDSDGPVSPRQKRTKTGTDVFEDLFGPENDANEKGRQLRNLTPPQPECAPETRATRHQVRYHQVREDTEAPGSYISTLNDGWQHLMGSSYHKIAPWSTERWRMDNRRSIYDLFEAAYMSIVNQDASIGSCETVSSLEQLTEELTKTAPNVEDSVGCHLCKNDNGSVGWEWNCDTRRPFPLKILEGGCPDRKIRSCCIACLLKTVERYSYDVGMALPLPRSPQKSATSEPGELETYLHFDTLCALYDYSCQPFADMPSVREEGMLNLLRILVKSALFQHKTWHLCEQCDLGYFRDSDSVTTTCPFCLHNNPNRWETEPCISDYLWDSRFVPLHDTHMKRCPNCGDLSVPQPLPAMCQIVSCMTCGLFIHWEIPKCRTRFGYHVLKAQIPDGHMYTAENWDELQAMNDDQRRTLIQQQGNMPWRKNFKHRDQNNHRNARVDLDDLG